MYKTKVQELCQRRSWSLPEYQTTRDGPDHNPSFISTITVNGITFQTPSPCRTAKESQNNAAMLAFDHFSSSQPVNNSFPTPPPKPKLMLRSKPMPSPPPPPLSFIHEPTIPGLGSFPQPTFLGHSFPQPSLFTNSAIPSLSTSSSSYCSPGPGTDVNNILPINSVFQQRLEGSCQSSQITSPATPDRVIMTTTDQKNMAHLYKNQLQNYAQKRNLKLPIYSPEWEGPPHAMRFKCKVTVDGQTYECPKFFSTLKDAEHAAAEVALMSLSPEGIQEDHTVLYKNLLQELIQREGFHLPVYSTEKSGEAHMPTFVSKVEVEGEIFIGKEAKTKKQAEMCAAKVAYTTLKECQGMLEEESLCALLDNQGKAPPLSSGCSESNVITGLEHHPNPKHPVSLEVVSLREHDKSKEPIVKMKKASSSSRNTNDCTKDTSFIDSQSAPSLSDSVPSTASDVTARKRLVVYSRKTNVKIEEGGTLDPISNEKWVAYSYSH